MSALRAEPALLAGAAPLAGGAPLTGDAAGGPAPAALTARTLHVVPEPDSSPGYPLGAAAVLIRGTDRTLWTLAARHTTERGGRFVTTRWGGLDYAPTGREPLLYVSSAGLPHPPAPDTGGVTPLLSAGPELVELALDLPAGPAQAASALQDALVHALGGLGLPATAVRAFLEPVLDVCLPPQEDPYASDTARLTHLRILRRLLEWGAGRYGPRVQLTPAQAGTLHAGTLAVLDNLARRLREQAPGARPALVTALRTALRSGLSPAEVARVDALVRRGLLRFVGVEHSLSPQGDGYRLRCSAHPTGGLLVVEPRRR